jgi:predicted phosphate transport protein (TIGR00153 family)
MPPSNTFSKLFSHSPIRPLQQHMAKVYECAQQLTDFFKVINANDWQSAEIIYNEISRIEGLADDDKKNIRLNLPKSLFMPISRNDLLELVSKQDKVANCAKDIAGIILGRKMQIPAQIQDLLTDYVQASIKTVAEANTIVHELDELIETGFGGREVEWIEKLITRLDALETQSDVQQVEIRSQLHIIENELSPVDVMFLYKIFETIGNLADRAQTVGDQIHVIVAR